MSRVYYPVRAGRGSQQGRGVNYGDIPYSELQKKYAMTTTGVANDFMQRYQRRVLADRRNDVSAFEDEDHHNTKHYSTSILNHRYHGTRSGKNPDMPEINVYDTEPDPRGTTNIPNMEKMAADLWAREYSYQRKMNTNNDDERVTGNTISDWEMPLLKKGTFDRVKNQWVMYETAYDNQVRNNGVSREWGHSAANMQIASDQQYGETIRMVEGRPTNYSLKASSMMPSNTGILHHTTQDHVLPVTRYGAAPRKPNQSLPSSVNHKNFQFESNLAHQMDDGAFQARKVNHSIAKVARQLELDGHLSEQQSTELRRSAERLEGALSASFRAQDQFKRDDSRSLAQRKQAVKDASAQVSRLINNDTNLREFYVETFRSKNPDMRQINSVVRLALNDTTAPNRSEDMVVHKSQMYADGRNSIGVKHTAHAQRAISVHDETNTHKYSGPGQYVAPGADKSMFAVDDKLMSIDHLDTIKHKSAFAKRNNPYLEQQDIELSKDYEYKHRTRNSGPARHTFNETEDESEFDRTA